MPFPRMSLTGYSCIDGARVNQTRSYRSIMPIKKLVHLDLYTFQRKQTKEFPLPHSRQRIAYIWFQLIETMETITLNALTGMEKLRRQES